MKRLLYSAALFLAVLAQEEAEPEPEPETVAGNNSTILKIASDVMTIEHTPGRIAIEDFYDGPAKIVEGGIAALLSDPTVALGTNAEIPSLKSYGSNRDLRIIYTMTETYYRIVANRNAGIETLEDLKGKRIGTIPTTTAAYFVEKYLGTVGLEPDDYELAYGGTCLRAPCGRNTLPMQLANGTIDAIALWEPTPQFAVNELGDDAIVFQDRSVYREVVNLQSTAPKLADPETRALIVEFVRSLNAAQRVFAEEPTEDLYQRVADATGSQADVIEQVWGIHGWRGTLVGDIYDVLKTEDQWVAQLQGRDKLTEEEIEALVDTSILEEALGLSLGETR
ncbi:unnamed protein product [Parascedosporium putredinis]|uniref:SsuA/THI5-like domain-containing protein n=1 Tax=Parascedosporium putredinis TaxID=1442378 RepID=A0A9P1GZ86_9PEZI|nr:unnamed protein product [Parascedosporium putredinis]CAI7991559.1 unnamed protein product [Parascedosporium putredinis]